MRSCKLFLGGLTKATTTELLYATFAPYGCVVDAVVMERNGMPRGFGFVTFADEDGVRAVLASTVLVDGREVDIKRAVPEEEMDNAPTKVFVGGLPQKVDRTSLKAHFARYGDVRDCVVMMDRSTGRSRGFGFVRFSSSEAVEAVLSAPQVLDGQVVDCKRAQPAEALPPPKNPRTRGQDTARTVPVQAYDFTAMNQWAMNVLSATQGQNFDWSTLDSSYEAAYDPTASFPAAFDPAAFDPTALESYAFDPAAFASYDTTTYETPAEPKSYSFSVHNGLPAPQLPLPSLPIATEPAAKPAPLGDLSNFLQRKTKGKVAPSSPLGDLSNLLQSRENRSENTGFSSALKEAMKAEATSAAAFAFAH